MTSLPVLHVFGPEVKVSCPGLEYSHSLLLKKLSGVDLRKVCAIMLLFFEVPIVRDVAELTCCNDEFMAVAPWIAFWKEVVLR